MAVYRDRRTGTWRWRAVVHLPDGTSRRISGTPDLDTRRDAEQAERDGIRLAHERARFPERYAKPPPKPTFGEVAKLYLQHRAPLVLRPSTLDHQRGHVLQHLRPRLGALPVDAVTAVVLDGLTSWLLAGREGVRPMRPASVNVVLATARSILHYARELGHVEHVAEVHWQEIAPRPMRFLTEAQCDALVTGASPEPLMEAAVLLGCDAGLRLGEIMALCWDATTLDGDAPSVEVRCTEWEGKLGPPKSGQARTVPVTERLAAALRGLERTGDRVLDVRGRFEGMARTTGAFRAGLRRALARSGLVLPWSLGYHVLRHSYCTRLARAGASAHAIRLLAGHATLQQSLAYVHLTETDVVHAVRLLDRPSVTRARPAAPVRRVGG